MKQIEKKIKIKDLIDMYSSSKINFYLEGYGGIRIERKNTWNLEKKSLFIDSILSNMIIPPIYVEVQGDNYFIIDGKQRLLTIIDYINNFFAISGNFFDPIGGSLNGVQYFTLLPSLQHKIMNYELTIIEQSGTKNESLDTFIRCNNGESVQPIEIFRAKVGEHLQFLNEICSHKLFSLLELGKTDSFRNYELALYFLMLEANPSTGLAKREKEEFVKNISTKKIINSDIKNNLIKKLDYLFKVFNRFEYNKLEQPDKYLKKSHILIIYKILDSAFNNKITENEFFKWSNRFFYLNKNDRNKYWIESSRGSTTAKASMDIRYYELKHNFDSYFLKKSISSAKTKTIYVS